MFNLLGIGFLGLTNYQWILIILLVISFILGLVKKAFKLVKLVIFLGIVYFILTYLGVL